VSDQPLRARAFNRLRGTPQGAMQVDTLQHVRSVGCPCLAPIEIGAGRQPEHDVVERKPLREPAWQCANRAVVIGCTYVIRTELEEASPFIASTHASRGRSRAMEDR
jgi:hypothetical protein